MNNNKENYKKAVEQVHAKESLKEKTLEKMNKPKKKIYKYINYLAACATIILVVGATIAYTKRPEEVLEITKDQIKEIKEVAVDLPRFESMEQLKDILEKKYGGNRNILSSKNEEVDSFTENVTSDLSTETSSQSSYSQTNIQVENVDEADIVKTDGNYIYYTKNDKVYIVKADNLELKSEIEVDEDDIIFSPREIFLKGNKLIVLGSLYENNNNLNRVYTEDETVYDIAYVDSSSFATVKVFDITDKSNPKEERTVSLEGNYINSRMIGNNLYFISQKYANYYNGIKDEDILPSYKDSKISDKSNQIECTDIVYFEDTNSYSYMLVGGFNIENDKEVNIETFFGANSEIYASEKNLYILASKLNSNYSVVGNNIYKFELQDGNVTLKAKGEVKGYVKDQFAIDEYDGNLRIATTIQTKENETYVDEFNGITTVTLGSAETTTQLTIFDENLNQIGIIEDLAKNEKIYSVRFIGKIGYVVTFEQVDPLFVIDLSDPTNPTVKGELKIPGYSSYLHPYDETHLIGIGYNTKSNGYGGVTNDNMKMSMFDVSDLENPKEIFSIDIGNGYTYSEIINNHKTLFYNKEKNLIGFTMNSYNYKENEQKDGFVLYKIDLENGFQEYSDALIMDGYQDYKYRINRAIYIDDVLYTLSNCRIISYDLNTMEELKRLDLEE